MNRILKETSVRILSRLLPRKVFADMRYRYTFGHTIDWENPRDLNEWINVFMTSPDRQKWARMADKIAVRDIVKSKGLGEILLPVYGVWDNAGEIDFSILPSSFVLKTNHGCGTNIIVDSEHSPDRDKIVEEMDKWLGKTFGTESCENHYSLIRPRIYAEKLIRPESQYSGCKSLVDYKIWCIGGKPLYIFLCYDRGPHHLTVDMYDADWNRRDDAIIYEKEYHPAGNPFPKPECLDEMLRCAAILSEGEPQMRVDLYESEGRPIFGELTLSSCGGKMNYFKPEFLRDLGDRISTLRKENPALFPS